MRILLLVVTLLVLALADVPGHTFLEYGVPTIGEFTKDKALAHYYIDVADNEKLSIAIEADMPVEILLAQDPFPQMHNASWGGANYFELGPGNPNYFPGRFYITLRPIAEMEMEFTVSGYSDTPMMEEIPTTGIIRENGYAFFSYPVCMKGKLTVEVFSEGTTQGMYLSQQWAHPTSAEGRHSYKTTSGRIQIDVRSPGRMYVGVKGKTGDEVILIGNMDNEIETIPEYGIISGSIIRGCARHYKFDSIDETSAIPLTIIAEEDYVNSEVFLYLSHGEHNIFPDRYDYDDVTFLEVGAATHFDAFEFIDGTAYFGIEAHDASPWIGSKYAFMVSQHHDFIYEGYETRVSIPSTTEGALFVISRTAEYPVRYIAAEVAFSDVRERDNHDYLIMGSHDDPKVEGEGSCAGTWGYMECQDTFDLGEQIRYFIRVIYKDHDAQGVPPTEAKLLASFVYEAALYEKYDGHIEKDEWITFAVDIPADESGFDVYVQANTNGDGFIELYGGWDRIPTSHKSFHKWRGVPSGYQREIRIPKEEMDFGREATIYFSIRGTTKATYNFVAFTGRHLPLPNAMKYNDYIAPMSVVHYFYIPDSDWHHDGAILIFSLQVEEDAPITMYISSHFENPDEENHDWVVTPTSGALIVNADDPSYRHDMGTYFITILNSGDGEIEDVIYFDVMAVDVDPLIDDRSYIDFVSAANINSYLFRSDAHDADHYLEVEPLKPIGTTSGSGSLNVFVSSIDMPNKNKHEYALTDMKYKDGTKYIAMLHYDGVRGHEGAPAGTFLVNVQGHDMFNMYQLTHYTSIHLSFDNRIGFSVMNNEHRYFNVRVSDDLYSHVKSNGYVDVTLSPSGRFDSKCVDGLSIYGSDKNIHPSPRSSYLWGGKGKQSIRVMGSDENFHVGRIYVNVVGETSGCAFDIIATRSFGHYTTGTIFGWIFTILLISGVVGGGAYAFVFYRKNPQRIPQWVPARFRSTQYDAL
ncbi:hypothetical protein GEMRC1_011981 [Eukaryota sp. GEM-RC1]